MIISEFAATVGAVCRHRPRRRLSRKEARYVPRNHDQESRCLWHHESHPYSNYCIPGRWFFNEGRSEPDRGQIQAGARRAGNTRVDSSGHGGDQVPKLATIMVGLSVGGSNGREDSATKDGVQLPGDASSDRRCSGPRWGYPVPRQSCRSSKRSGDRLEDPVLEEISISVEMKLAPEIEPDIGVHIRRCGGVREGKDREGGSCVWGQRERETYRKWGGERKTCIT